MTDGLKQWLKDIGVMGMIPVQTPMKDRTELNSDMRLLSDDEATMVRSRMGGDPNAARPRRGSHATWQ